MKQISLKFNTHIRNTNIINHDIEKIIFRFIFWSFGALALLYVLFLGNMVKDIIERRSLELNARVLLSEVRDLELAYLSMSNSIDLNLSYSLGFKETQATFATRKALGLLSADESFDSVKIAPNDL